MGKNIDKFVESPKSLADLLHDEDMETEDERLQFDSEGNIVFSDTDKEILDTDTENDDEDTEEESEDTDTLEATEVTEPAKTAEKKPSGATKEQLKIINMKKDLQKVQQEKRELEERLSKIDNEKKKTDIVKKYVMDGVDEDVAAKYAEQEIRNDLIEEKLELIDFRETNYELLQKYPQAKADAMTIIKNSKLTGMTAEQICKAMYAESDDVSYQTKIKKAMTSGNETQQHTSTESASRASINKSTATLSSTDKALKARIERTFNGGKPLTDDEIKIIMKHL